MRDVGGFATEFTTVSDITFAAVRKDLLSRSGYLACGYCLVISNGAVPVLFGTSGNSYARAAAVWVTIFVGQSWTNTHAFLFDSHRQFSARWTCWRAFVTGLGGKWFAKRLSFIFRLEPKSQNSLNRRPVGEYVHVGSSAPC